MPDQKLIRSHPTDDNLDRPAAVSILGVKRYYRDGDRVVQALSGIDLTIETGSFFTILGPSGCGKSTLLNIIAGFDRQDAGTVLVDGKIISQPSAERGVVFQDSAALFPWLTVEKNVGFGLKSIGKEAPEIAERVAGILALTGLSAFAAAYPNQLSGGMRQLVAISRVLVMEPKLLLMDEPFAALDAITRQHLQTRLVEIWKRTGITVLFITHSVDEAIILSDEVAVMSRRPGLVRKLISIDLPRPRVTTSAQFNSFKEEALISLSEFSEKEQELS